MSTVIVLLMSDQTRSRPPPKGLTLSSFRFASLARYENYCATLRHFQKNADTELAPDIKARVQIAGAASFDAFEYAR